MGRRVEGCASSSDAEKIEDSSESASASACAAFAVLVEAIGA